MLIYVCKPNLWMKIGVIKYLWSEDRKYTYLVTEGKMMFEKKQEKKILQKTIWRIPPPFS